MKIIIVVKDIIFDTVARNVKSQYGIMMGINGEVGSDNFTPPPFWTGNIGVAGQRMINENYRCMIGSRHFQL